MKLKVERYGLRIEPESEIDIVYIEEILGLKTEDDTIKLRRENAHGLSCIAYLTTEEKLR